jgi:hypothetical protein
MLSLKPVKIGRVYAASWLHVTNTLCVEFKLAKFLQLIGTIKSTVFRKVRTETILKIYNTLILPTFLYGSEKWILTASQRRRIEAA